MLLMVTEPVIYEFLFEGGLLCLDFSNTVDFYADGAAVLDHDGHALTSYEALLAFAEQAGLLDASQAAALRELAAKQPAQAATVLARALGFEPSGNFMKTKGSENGARILTEISRTELVERLQKATGASVHVCPGGPEIVRNIGIMTGGAGSEVAAAAKSGVDTFITGEGPHWSYTLAEEIGINLIYGGHYATETFGVKALAEHLNSKFELPWEFIDHPTGL